MRIRKLGRSDYHETWRAMREFTEQRGCDTADELWITEHEAVFTQGLNGRAEHILAPGDIPVVQIDRGGQVTYHGPGQLLLYCLLDIQRMGIGIKSLVGSMERAAIELLRDYGIAAHARPGAPGVYVNDAKIAALGLRVRKGCCYHGLSLNVDLDLEPFGRIDPCGYRGLEVTRLRDFDVDDDLNTVGETLANKLTEILGEKKPGSAGRQAQGR
jgi:lipoyl(octanoyl) transferase